MEFTRTSNDKNAKLSRLTNRVPAGTNKLQRPKHTTATGSKSGGSLIKQDDPICTVTVTCGALNVRSEASQSARRIGGVTEGKTLNVYEVSGDWLKVGYGTGYGWVMSKYTSYTPEIPEPEDPKPEDPKPENPKPEDPLPADPVDTSEVGDTGEDYGTQKRGSSTTEGVMVLQRYLNLYLKKYNGMSFGTSTFQPLKVDGSFGKQTFIHLSYYQYSRNIQNSKGINVDGSCGPKTWKTLRSKAPEVYNITEPSRFSKFQYLGPFNGVTISGGGKMHSEAAAKFEEMYAAAKKDNYTLNTSNAYRGMTDEESFKGSDGNNNKGQIELWERNTDTPELCALPGKSKHQGGIAADFKDMKTQSTAKFKWMNNNASKFGFKNYEKEAWHWYYAPLA